MEKHQQTFGKAQKMWRKKNGKTIFQESLLYRPKHFFFVLRRFEAEALNGAIQYIRANDYNAPNEWDWFVWLGIRRRNEKSILDGTILKF